MLGVCDLINYNSSASIPATSVTSCFSRPRLSRPSDGACFVIHWYASPMIVSERGTSHLARISTTFATAAIARLPSGLMSWYGQSRQQGISKAHVILITVYTLGVESLATIALFLRRAQADPDVPVESEDNVHTGRAARRRQVVKVRLEPTDQSRWE